MAGESILGSVIGCLPCACIGSFILFFIGIFAAVIYLASKQKGKYEDALRSLALEVGGEFKKGSMFESPSLSGVYKGRKFFIDTFSRTTHDMDDHNQTTYYMRIQLWHKANIKGEVRVSKEGLFSGLGKVLGAQDIQIGNDEFDKVFMIAGDEKLAKKLIDIDLQRKLLDFKTGISLLSERVYFERVCNITEKEKIKDILNLMTLMAEKAEKM